MSGAALDRIRKAREARRALDESLSLLLNQVRSKEQALFAARRLGDAGAERANVLERELTALRESANRQRASLRSLQDELSGLVGELVLPPSPAELAARLDDALPCLLLPVRIETRFMPGAAGRELWVRVYPDDIAVHTHDKTLTRDEADAGVEYFTTLAAVATLAGEEERKRLELGAWRALSGAYGGTRAAFLRAEIEQRTLAKPENTDTSLFLVRARARDILNDPRTTASAKRALFVALLAATHPFVVLIRAEVLALLGLDGELTDETRRAVARLIDDRILVYLGFDLEKLNPESWSRAPRTEVMPDRFVLVGITDGVRREFPFPASIPSPLILGPNPQNLEQELAQAGTDLAVGKDFAWIWDFEKAIEVGMAMRVELPEPFASAGFDRLLVLGLRVSSEPPEHRELLEALVDNHHFSPEGFDLVPQGTATNHTADARAGFSRDDSEGEASFETETAQAPLAPAVSELEKGDAQRLAEAWDIGLEKFANLRNSELRDVSRAKSMNQALWPATLGFFLDELLELDAVASDKVRRFFTGDVVARGSLPAIRAGKQPYGVLVTSAFQRWQSEVRIDGEEADFLTEVHAALARAEAEWQRLVGGVSRVGAPGDSFAALLNILGLQPTSADFQRRIGTEQTLLWNVAHFMLGRNFVSSDPVARYFDGLATRRAEIADGLGFEFSTQPKLFRLSFSDRTSPLNGPLVADVVEAADEKLSETDELPARYALAGADPDTVVTRNYIGWIVSSGLDALKNQLLSNESGEPQPVPSALLFRLLHRALLLAGYDATLKLYDEQGLVDAAAVRREQDFTNVEAARTVTRWEFMQANVADVMPELGSEPLSVADFLSTQAGSARPAAELLREVREAIGALEHFATADLERLMVEHLDLCSYRLDAWQGALFSRRLARLNLSRQNPNGGVERRGVHLGAFGWLENVRPAPPAPVVPEQRIPEVLREDGVKVVEQPNNGGYIHGPSINHAVAAAVLRSAYLSHASQADAEHFSVRLTSERVRTALSILEGVRNGQELAALLGYQFERALYERHVIDGKALAQFILAFRKRYPLVADKVTPDAEDAPIERKEAYQVVDGYALLEAVFLSEPKLEYPFGVEGLPAADSDGVKQAIIQEVERLRQSLDAIADLSLAEGVFQATQGNHERAGAMLKAMSEGHAPPEPEIVRTPRGGATVHHKLVIHFETGAVTSPWGGAETPRARAAPGLNCWLGERIGAPDSLAFSVSYDLDASIRPVALSELALQPIDLVLMLGDEVGALEGTRPVNDLTELELRIDRAYRLARKAAEPGFDPSGRTMIAFMSREGLPASARTLFELLPLLRTLRNVVTTCRPLGADDYLLASEQNTDTTRGDIKRWQLGPMLTALDVAANALDSALAALQTVLNDVPPDALKKNPAEVPDLGGVDYAGLSEALVRLSLFAVTTAFPKQAFLPELAPGASDAERLGLLRARQSLIEQGFSSHADGKARHAEAATLRTLSKLTSEEKSRLTPAQKAEIFQRSAALLLGDAFRIVPLFSFENLPELQAARAFSTGAAVGAGLLRFTEERLAAAANGAPVSDWRKLAIDEWLAGVSAVRKQARWIDELETYGDALDGERASFEVLQLPFDEQAHWIGLELPAVSPGALDDPAVFVPRGDFLSVVRHLPAGHAATQAQAGLVVDEWNEVIPNRIETTGIAVHYDQPNTEPPQCLLLAVSPTIKGHWEWDDLVETVIDTFERAKRRAVEPDSLRTTPYAQLLPAVLSSFTSHPLATISTNFAAQSASLVVEGGS